MKLLITKQKSAVFLFLTLLILLSISNTGYGQDKGQAEAINPPLSERTLQIQDAIVAAVPGVNSADDVTPAHLAAIATLNGSNKSISALKAGDFNGLTALTTLDLSRNAITDVSVLEKLTKLTTLNLSQNAITDVSALEKLTKLRWLYLPHNAIEDIAALEKLTSLRHLQLSGNAIKDIAALEKLTSLRKLWLSQNAIKNIAALEKLTSLDALWLDGNSIRDVSALEGLIALVSLNLRGNPISDHAPLRRLRAAKPDISIDIDIDVDVNNNNAPVFTAGSSTTRTVAENTASGRNIGTAIAATDADNDTLTYTLGGTDASAFSIVSTSGQLQTKAGLDYETKTSYSVSVSVSDGNDGSDSIEVTISVTDVNEKPNFPTKRATRTVAENTASGTNIGDPFQATDLDNADTLTYSLHRGDARSFRINPSTGHLRTHASLDFETKKVYNDLAIRATDSKGNFDAIFVTINVTNVNEAPSFATSTATRSVAENTAADTNIGAAIAATDVDANTTLTYTLGGTDAASFRIDRTNGQLQTKAALDYETKTSYSVTITVSDSQLTDTIDVTINVTDVDENRAPAFAEGTSTTRAIAENTASETNIGSAVSATDPDNDTLTYTLGGVDATSFSINGTNGQLQTKAALDYETKTSYSVTVSVSDGKGGSDSITVTINITDVNENRAPVFTDGSSTTRAVAENTGSGQNIGTTVSATDADTGDTLTYTLGGADAASFSINGTNGQLKTSAALDYEAKTSYSVTITASDTKLTDTIDVTITVTNVNEAPSFTEGSSATRAIAENTASETNIGSAVSATDPDNDTLTYTLGGADAASFGINGTNGQLKTSAALDYEAKSSYSVTITVSDTKLTDTIDVTINVANVDENRAPAFAEGTSTTRSVAENTGSGQNIGTMVSATDADNDTLTYSLSGADADSFSIVNTSGQLQTKAALDYETKVSYTVIVSVSDGNGGSDSITVTITVRDVNENRAPVFTAGSSTTRAVAENTGSGQDIGTTVSATDADNDTLTYSLSGADAAAFSINGTNGQLQTKTALDYEIKTSYAVTVSVSDSNGGSDSSTVTINVTNVNEAPSFATNTATRSIAENTVANTNIGTAFTATDPDTGDTLTYTLGGADASSFSIVSTFGQLQTNIALDHETKASYSVTVTATDGGNLSDTTTVTINVTNVNEAPNFTEGSSATRTIAENTVSGTNIGMAVAATDVDANTTLTYTLGGTDAASFRINGTNGQLRTRAALDYEAKTSYSVTITVSDSQLTDTIDVTINVTDVDENRAPAFAEGTSTTRSVAENTGAGQDIGSAVAATDPDDDALTYTLGGTDAAAFSIDDTNGQLQTSAALDYETKAAYTVRITVSDGELTDSINVTINITDVNENRAPVFTDGSATTRSVAENTGAGQDIGSAVAATDPNADTLTYTLGGADAAAFSINGTNGQLQTKTALDYEAKTSYSVTITVSDTKLTDSIDVTINVTNVNEAPSFANSTATRSIAENTASGEDIGAAVVATDPDSDDTLTYTLGGTDVDSFSIVNTSGQLRTNVALDHETKDSYSVTVTATDGDNLSDTTTVTITVTNVNEAPSFTEGSSATRATAENTASETNIGGAVAATDPDDDTLTYTLGGADAASFSINDTNGQLKTKAALDYETQTSYTVTITVSDSELTDTIDVRINVTDVDENRAPSFTEGNKATRSVAENTGSGQDIGSAVSATDLNVDTLTYTLSGADAASFSINGTNGQLQTKTALDYEAKTSYSVIITVSDTKLTDSIDVTISVTDVNEAPHFANSTATRSIAENTASGEDIGDAVVATDPDTDDTLTYTLGGTDVDSFSIVNTSGQLRTNVALDHETKDSYSVTITATDGGNLSDTTTVTITVTNVNEAPSFTEGSSATRAIAENTASETNIGSAVSATDPDDDTLTYTLGGADAASFGIDGTNGQLQTSGALDYEAKTSYTVTITVSDSQLTDTIDVTINVTDADENRAPSFAEGTSATRAIAENTASETNIGTAVAATDPDTGDTLTYTLGGADAAAFSINGTNGQLQTKTALDYETQTSYTVTITVSDSELTDTIDVTISVTNVNEAPNFATNTATRSVAENTSSGKNIGTAVTATDMDTGDTLRYTLGGADAASFTINSTNGQLKTKAALDHETKTTYAVTVTATDGGNLSDTISVTITVTNVNEAPNFTEGSSATRSVAENTAANTNIGAVIAATDLDANTTLAYTLGGVDAAAFSIVSTNGQLKTKAALDYETKTSYTVTITVSDDELTDTIDVRINVTDVDEILINPPLSDRTQQVQDAIVAAVPDVDHADDVTVAHLATINHLYLGHKNITSLKSGDFNDLPALTSLILMDNSISDISVLAGLTTLTNLHLDGNSISDISALEGLTTLRWLYLKGNPISDYGPLRRLIAAIDGIEGHPGLTLDINIPPVFTEGTSTTRAVPENTASGQAIGAVVSATDVDSDTLTYRLSGTDAASFSINGTNGQLQTKTALDYETKNSYSVSVDVSDGSGGSDSIPVTISVTNVNEAPSFTEGSTATRTIAENTAAGTNIGTAVAATDPDTGDTLTYTLGGTDAAAFSIVSTNGQLKTKATLDYETKTSYTLTITASDSKLTDTIDVTINITDVDEILINPPLSDRTQQVQDAIVAAVPDVDHPDDVPVAHLAAINHLYLGYKNITSLKSGDFNDLPALRWLILMNNSISDISALAGLTALTDLYLQYNSISNISALSGLTTLTHLDLQNNSINDISALAGLTALIRLDLRGNSISDISALEGLTTLTKLYLKGNPISDYGPLRRLIAAIDGIEGHPGLTLDNLPPVFTDGTSTTRAVAENTPSGQDIGAAVSATDMNNDTLTYSLGGTDAASFRIDGASGQLQTRGALDYETKTFYSVTVSVSDGDGSSDSIDVTINVTNVNEAPSFTDGANTTRAIAENTASDTNIGMAVAAIDPDTGDTLTYTLGGADAASFSINGTNGQLQTKAALDYETKTSYTLTITVSDSKLTDTIDVTINITDVNERQPQIVKSAPVFTEGTSTTRTVAENTVSGTNIGSAIAATDADNDTLTYSLEGTDAAAFSIVNTSGQLQTKAALDYETKSSYSVTITVSDGTLTDTISVTINVTDLDESHFPTFTEGDSTTRSIAENTALGVDIGNPVAATDPDTGDTLTYSLGGTDVFDFTIVPTSGQLRLNSHLNYERKTSYSVTVFVSDGNGGSDSISVTINVTDVNEAPRFTESVRTIRTITENTASGQNIGSAVSATDPDTGDTLTYSLSGTDAASFSIVDTSGQLRTKAALDYETKSIYSVTITVSDGSLTDSISVTISVAPIGGTTIDPPLSDRTQQVRDTIVRAAKVGSVDDVTGAHLAAISRLGLSSKGITSLKTGDFAGLTNLQYLYMNRNSINDISALANLTSLINLELHSNSISDISPLANLTSLTNLNLMHNSISDISTLSGLTSLTNLGLNNNSISDISVLEHLTSLKTLLLSRNSISDISVLEHLTSLKDLALYGNSISDISVLSNLSKLRGLGLSKNSISDISALEDLTAMEYLYLGSNSISDISALAGLTKLHTLYLYDNSISDISALEGLTSLRWLQLYDNSISDISALEGLTWLVELKLADNSISDYGPLRRLKVAIELIERHPGLPLHPGLTLDITIPAVANNNVPVFTDGDNTTRSIAENTDSGTNIGNAVSATDSDTADTLTYYLGGTDAKSFSIVRTSGQLQTNAALDYETKDSYTVTVAVSDGKGGTDSITVTITVTDVVGAAPSVQTPPALPATTALLTNFPNPFNPETWIPYQLAKPAEVTLTLYDIRGVVVRELKLGHQPAGIYHNRSRAIHWDGRNAFGEKVATGVYFYTLKAGDFTATRKLLIRK